MLTNYTNTTPKKWDVESTINVENAVNFSDVDGRKFFVKLSEHREYNIKLLCQQSKRRRYFVSRWTVAPIVDIKEC